MTKPTLSSIYLRERGQNKEEKIKNSGSNFVFKPLNFAFYLNFKVITKRLSCY